MVIPVQKNKNYLDFPIRTCGFCAPGGSGLYIFTYEPEKKACQGVKGRNLQKLKIRSILTQKQE